MLWWDFSSVSSESVVRRVLSSDLNVLIFVELLDEGDLQEDWGNDDIWNERKQVPTLLELWLSLLTTLSIKAWVSLTPLLDFQFPPTNLLFLENRFLKRRVLNISFCVKLNYNKVREVWRYLNLDSNCIFNWLKRNYLTSNDRKQHRQEVHRNGWKKQSFDDFKDCEVLLRKRVFAFITRAEWSFVSAVQRFSEDNPWNNFSLHQLKSASLEQQWN